MTSYIQIILLFKEQNSKLSPKKYVFDFKFYNQYFYVAKFVFNSPQLQNHHKNSYFYYIYIKLVLLCPVTWETRGSVGWACVAHLSFCFEETLYRTFHGASYQISVHLATHFQRRRLFRNRPIRNKNYLWWPCLLTDRN